MKDICCTQQNHTGFTLFEVMVAISILAIVLTAVFGSQSQSISLSSEAKFNTTASLLAQSKMAEMEAIKPEELSSEYGDFEDDFSNYHWEVSVKNITFAGITKSLDSLKQIDLTVSWGEDDRYQYHIRLFRFIPKG